ncbi:MAG TPA: hypothetical protein VIX82_00135 [Solirubrobacteraceae bacterium]
MHTRKVRVVAAFAAFALALTLVTSALAAHPKAGKRYTGFTSATLGMFRAPGSFKVSNDGKMLLAFQYGNLGCLGGGGFGNKNPYTGSRIRKLGSIKVASTGAFSAKGRKATNVSHGNTDTLTSSLTGMFSTSKLANGTISYKEKITGHGTSQHCNLHVTFSVKPK